MLQTSILIDGTKAKTLNALCKERVANKPTLDDLTKVVKGINDQIKDICIDEFADGGLYETSKYLITVSVASPKVTITASEVESKAPELFKQLVELGLVKIGEKPIVTLKDVKTK